MIRSEYTRKSAVRGDSPVRKIVIAAARFILAAVLFFCSAAGAAAQSAFEREGAVPRHGGSGSEPPAQADPVDGTGDAVRRVLTVGEAVDLALENNLSLLQARLRQDKLALEARRIWNDFLPGLSGSASLSYQDSAASVSGTASPLTAGFGFQARLDVSGELFASIRQTRHAFEAGKIALAEAEEMMRRDVRKLFYGLVLVRRQIVLSEKKLEAARKRYALAEQDWEMGLISEYEVLSTRVGYENLKPELRRLRREYETRIGEFKLLLGIDKAEAVAIEGEIGITEIGLDAEALIAEHIEDRFDLRSKRSEIEGYRLLQTSRRAGMAPDVSLSFSLGGSVNGPFTNPWFGASGAWISSYPRLSVSLSLPIDPLLPGSRLREEIAKTETDMEAAELGLLELRKSAELTIESLVENLRDKQEYISVLRLNVELARKAASIAEDDYELGRTDLQTVEEAQLELEKAEAAVLEEEYNFVIALLDLEYALNTDLAGI